MPLKAHILKLSSERIYAGERVHLCLRMLRPEVNTHAVSRKLKRSNQQDKII